ncbi:MAG: hypothetical protein LBB47_08240, partial [Spirochaetaceae bacterium]|nr:hypothetical protein [Spirochaetaceae bacterium]
LTCCYYSYERLVPNYLDVTIDEIINLRNNADFCKKCIKYSLHRFWDPSSNAKYLTPLLSKLSEGNAVI